MTSSLLECPVCKGNDLVHDLPYINIFWPRLDYFNKLKISFCKNCGFGFSWPILPDEIVGHFYKYEYRNINNPFYIDFSSMFLPLHLASRSYGQLFLAKQFVNFNNGDCFLDIGPGNGQSFNVAKAILPNPVCCAIELNQGAEKAFHRLYKTSTYSSIHNFNLGGQQAKICLLSHSLEHYSLSFLKEYLIDLKSILAPQGILVVEVPLVDFRIHEKDKRIEDSPHFLFFTIDSLKILFNACKWKILFIDSVGELYDDWFPKKIKEIESVKTRPPKISSIFSKLLKKTYSEMPVFLQSLFVRFKRKQGDIPDFNHPTFSYGGDRTCIRIILQPYE